MHFLARNFGRLLVKSSYISALTPIKNEIAKNDTTRRPCRSEARKLLPPLTGMKCEPGGFVTSLHGVGAVRCKTPGGLSVVGRCSVG